MSKSFVSKFTTVWLVRKLKRSRNSVFIFQELFQVLGGISSHKGQRWWVLFVFWRDLHSKRQQWESKLVFSSHLQGTESAPLLLRFVVEAAAPFCHIQQTKSIFLHSLCYRVWVFPQSRLCCVNFSVWFMSKPSNRGNGHSDYYVHSNLIWLWSRPRWVNC